MDAAAAAVFAAATAYAASSLFGLAAAPSALIAFLPVFVLLRQVAADVDGFPSASFQFPELWFEEQGAYELRLTADMVLGTAAADPNELILDDVLAQLGPDSRVVRLFDPAQMFTPGELKASIDEHLAASRSASNAPDATQALSDALAQLRRSLR